MTLDFYFGTMLAVILVLLPIKIQGTRGWGIPGVVELVVSLCLARCVLYVVQAITPPKAFLDAVPSGLGVYVFFTVVLVACCVPIGILTWRASRRLHTVGFKWPSVISSIGTIATAVVPFVHWLHLIYR